MVKIFILVVFFMLTSILFKYIMSTYKELHSKYNNTKAYEIHFSCAFFRYKFLCLSVAVYMCKSQKLRGGNYYARDN